jgi:hypothetical protein
VGITPATGLFEKNTPVTITANATGGSELEYKFELYKEMKLFFTRGYLPSKTMVWTTPSEAGEYKLKAFVRNKGTAKEYESRLEQTYTVK